MSRARRFLEAVFNIDKVKKSIGPVVVKHIMSLDKKQLEKQLKELQSEISRTEKENKKDPRIQKLRDEEKLILARLGK